MGLVWFEMCVFCGGRVMEEGKARQEKGKRERKGGGALPYISWGRYARDLKVTYLPTYLLG